MRLIQLSNPAPSPEQELTRYLLTEKKSPTNGQIKSMSHCGCIPRPLKFPQISNEWSPGPCDPEDTDADVALDTTWQPRAPASNRKHT